jgi:hypothetical protein
MLINDFDLCDEKWSNLPVTRSRSKFKTLQRRGKVKRGLLGREIDSLCPANRAEVGGQDAIVAALAQHVARGKKGFFALMRDQSWPSLCLKLTADYIK